MNLPWDDHDTAIVSSNDDRINLLGRSRHL